MNCRMCNLHIVATMQIMWGGYPYHPECIGDAVAQNRAAEEQPIQRLGTIESFEEEFPHGISDDDFDELEDYENQAIWSAF